MRLPPYLHPGDTIAITCPSGYLPMEQATLAIATLKEWGYNVIKGTTVGNAYHYFSDTDDNRLKELQCFMDNPSVKAIVMGRGGYGLSRIIDDIDFSNFVTNPKWICGFSDITLLLVHIQKIFGIASLHSPMCAAFKEESITQNHIISLKNMLEGETVEYPIPPNTNNKTGTARGVLTGGNLAMLSHVSGTSSQPDTKGKILFIEDVGEYLYSIDRMLINLKRTGLFNDIAGLVCGGFTDLQDTTRPLGQNIYEIILSKLKDFDYPVIFDFPSGHLDINFPLGIGLEYEMEVNENYVRFGQK